MKKLIICFVLLSQTIFGNTLELPRLNYEHLKDIREDVLFAMVKSIGSEIFFLYPGEETLYLRQLLYTFYISIVRVQNVYGTLDFDSIQNSARTLTLSAPIELQEHDEYIYLLTLSLHVFKLKEQFLNVSWKIDESKAPVLEAFDFLDQYINVHLDDIIEDLGLDADTLRLKRVEHTALLMNR